MGSCGGERSIKVIEETNVNNDGNKNFKFNIVKFNSQKKWKKIIYEKIIILYIFIYHLKISYSAIINNI